MIKDFEKNFENISDQDKEPLSEDKVLKPEIVEIVSLVEEDEFKLNNIDKIYDLIKVLFA